MDDNLWGSYYSKDKNNSSNDAKLEYENLTELNTPTSLKFPEGIKIKEVSSSIRHTIFLRVDGKVYCQGNNDFGQLGLSHYTGSQTPTLNRYLPKNIIQVATSQVFTLFLTGNLRLLTLKGKGKYMVQDLTRMEYSDVVLRKKQESQLKSLN